MKKIFPVLLLSMIIGLFSGCIIVPLDRYTFHFYNNTPSYVYDWYLKDKDENYYMVSDEYNVVAPDHYDSLSNLREKDYRVYFCVLSTVKKDFYAVSENFIHVDRDCTYYLQEDICYGGSPRSAVLSENETKEPCYFLFDSNGNRYPMKIEIINK